MLLNLAPDHLDRHGSFEAYVAAKLRIFARQGNDDIAVAPTGLGIEDLGGCARRVCFGGAGAELADRAGHLWWDEQAADRPRRDRAARRAQPPERDGRGRRLPGPRPAARGRAPTACGRSRASPHRLERDRRASGGVAYVNDSKATNVASTLVALARLPGRARCT